MGKTIKNLSIRSFRFVRSLSILALSTMLLLFLTPAHPLGEEADSEIDLIDAIRVEKIHETFEVYSLLMSHGMGLSEAFVWAMAQTILEESKKHSLDPMLVVALINVESRFQRDAVSRVGARGLMQIHPVFAPALAEEAEVQDWEGVKSLDKPILNIKLGTYYLGQMKRRFRDLKLALSAYNLGPTEVQKRLREGEIIPFGYVKRVLAVHSLYKRQERQAPIVLPIVQGMQGVEM